MVTNEITSFEPIDKEKVKGQILEFRGIKVMLDCDIAAYFGTETGALNRAMKRNIKRFPESFCFQLTDEELSRCQTGISMQTAGKKGGRTYNPYVYSEQGVAMLTSTLHTDRAIEASIKIMEAFVEMTHIIRQNAYLFPQQEIIKLSIRQDELQDEMKDIKKKMVSKSDLSDIMTLFEAGISSEEVLILDGEPFKADMAYQKIYKKAKKNIIVVDDYLGMKTLNHLTQAKNGLNITIISDNKGYSPLKMSEYNDFLVEYPSTQIKFLKSCNKVHDRYIVLDYGTKALKVYHCGASSKDAGNKVTTITELKEVDIYINIIADLLTNPTLRLTN